MKKIIAVFMLVCLLAVISLFVYRTQFMPEGRQGEVDRTDPSESGSVYLAGGETANMPYADPLPQAKSRITKKPFGIKVSPENSPVRPEKFSGYHTGVDLEVLPDEIGRNVTVRAFCEGKLVDALRVSGYGGVAVQECRLESEDVLVIYGHLKLASVLGNKGKILLPGMDLGFLGDAYSHDTDGERKHLHLGIVKGRKLDLRGYVQDPGQLAAWLDPEPYFAN